MNKLNNSIDRLWQKIFTIDHQQAVYVHDTRTTLDVIVEDTPDEAMMISQITRRAKVIRVFSLRYTALGFYPEKGDTIEIGGASYALFAPSGERIWKWADTAQNVLTVHGYAE